MNKKTLSNHDWELLSSYLDDQVTEKERKYLQTRLEQEPWLQEALDELRMTRMAVQALPKVRAPRNFTLTPEMVAVKKPSSKMYFAFRFASVFASILFVAFVLGDFFSTGSLPLKVSSPAPQVAPLFMEKALEEEAPENGLDVAEQLAENQEIQASDTLSEAVRALPMMNVEMSEETMGGEESAESVSQEKMKTSVVSAGEAVKDGVPIVGSVPETVTGEAYVEILTPSSPVALTTSTAPTELKVTPTVVTKGETTSVVEHQKIPLLRIVEIALLALAIVTGVVAIWIRFRVK